MQPVTSSDKRHCRCWVEQSLPSVAFAAIGTSQDSTGEYCRTLFSVILYSLMLSWLTAVTCTPLLCATFLKVTPATADASDDPYSKGFYKLYSNFLSKCIRFRWMVVAVTIALFISALLGFGYIKNSFFPDSTRPQFYVDIWFPEGTDIRATERQFKVAEAALKKHEGVTHLTSTIGGNQVRFSVDLYAGKKLSRLWTDSGGRG